MQQAPSVCPPMFAMPVVMPVATDQEEEDKKCQM
jgi:hypothetical protein